MGVLVVSIAAGVLAAACTRPAAHSEALQVSSSGSPVATASDAALSAAQADAATRADAAAPSLFEQTATSWSDPRLVALLAQDCDASYPVPPDPGEDSTDQQARDLFEAWTDPISCSADFVSQSCTFDPCFEGEHDPCKSRCAGGCDDCQVRCRASCTTCRTSCADDACRLRCATQCAGCLDGCVADRDRCGSGCSREYAACTQRTAAAFARTCRAPCQTCARACPDEEMACVTRCLARRFPRACNEQQRDICAWHGTNYGQE